MKEATYPGDPRDAGDKTVEEKLGTDECTAAEKRFEQETGRPVRIKKIKVRDVMRSQPARFDEEGKEAKQLSGDEWKGIIYAIEARNPGWKYKGTGANSCCCTWG
ncbi:MAG: hypothetical protein AB7G48_03430 [Nitrospiraceae bacterium]